MTTLREAAMRQALEMLEAIREADTAGATPKMVVEARKMYEPTITALKAALAKPVQEPVAWMYEWKHRLHGGSLNVSRARWPESDLWIETPLYAAPSQRKPGGSDEA